MSELSKANIHIQRHLFPALEEEFGTLSEKERQFVCILDLVDIPPFLSGLEWCGTGRKPASRLALAKTFIAKAVWNIPITSGLINRIKASPNLRRLCGWDSISDIPHESIFSRAFAAFALAARQYQPEAGRNTSGRSSLRPCQPRFHRDQGARKALEEKGQTQEDKEARSPPQGRGAQKRAKAARRTARPLPQEKPQGTAEGLRCRP